jgi:hypothetical protein
MAYHKLKVGDIVRILKSKPYPSDNSYPERFIGMIGTVIMIEKNMKYPYYVTTSDDITIGNYGFRRGELMLVKDYIPPNPIEARIKKLYGKCKTTAHWAV